MVLNLNCPFYFDAVVVDLLFFNKTAAYPLQLEIQLSGL